MKKTSVIIALMIFSLTSLAQRENMRNMSVEERAQMQTERMTTSLELDSTIIDQVHEINLKYAKQIEEGRGENISRFDMMKLMEKTNNAKNKELKAILTKDQYKKYMRQQQEMRNRMQEHMSSEGGGQYQQ
jgi:hypothetical protein